MKAPKKKRGDDAARRGASRMTPLGEELAASLREVLAHVGGEDNRVRLTEIEPAGLEVRRIRESVGLSQEDFARVLGISPSGLRKWEQNQRQPRGAARTLLQIMEKEPAAVARALRS
jgi:putative transcriptional regulator